MATRSIIAVQVENGFDSIYCQWRMLRKGYGGIMESIAEDELEIIRKIAK